jgi:GT2 family glycosyltransferase
MRGSTIGSGRSGSSRPTAHGKFLYADGQKVWVKGAAYGTFRPNEAGEQFPVPDRVQSDFAAMATNGINTVRTYTVPPEWLLDAAAEHELRLLVGVPWEQHVAFLTDRRRRRSIEHRVREGVRSCAGHPALLGYTVGNEIPAPIVRWHGRRRVEHFLYSLYEAAKEEDPAGLVTYVNFPSTEYLDLPFLDFVAFNVFLEERESLTRYLARLQNVADDRPLVMTEIGLDSRGHGLDAQAEVLDWQVRSVFEAGCAGAIVFTWTDEWYVSYLSEVGDTGSGGESVEDWDFGLVDRGRRAKPALLAVQRAFAEAPLPPDREWPRVSVVVCSYNGSRTIRRTCEGLFDLDYPDYEVIVVDDGSVDPTSAIASEFGFRVIRTENRGLSCARNTGFEAARGEYVVYIDDDAWPDRDWLRFLVHSFESTGAAAAGGPNVAPTHDSDKALAIARAPGGPVQVLLDDLRAEHLPGCNLAVRRSVLEEIGGFDPRFRVAGDDVDLCWRLLDRGETIVYSPGAMVWHQRRRSIRGYLKQQRGYGRAEALLEQKWPQKYNAGGHRTWGGRIYGGVQPGSLGKRRWRVDYGSWGTGLFQRLYQPAPSLVGSLRLMPEWWLLLLALAALAVLGLAWAPLVLALPLFVIGLMLSVTEAVVCSGRSWAGRWPSLRARVTTAVLYLVQPIARLTGRLGYGLTPWRRPQEAAFALPIPRSAQAWNNEWQPTREWLRTVERRLADSGVAFVRGGHYDRCDLRVRGGMLAYARLRHVIEEHGAGRQLARIRVMPTLSRTAIAVIGGLAALGVAAAADSARVAAAAILVMTSIAIALAFREAGWSSGALLDAIGVRHPEPETREHGLDTALLMAAEEASLPRVAAAEERV